MLDNMAFEILDDGSELRDYVEWGIRKSSRWKKYAIRIVDPSPLGLILYRRGIWKPDPVKRKKPLFAWTDEVAEWFKDNPRSKPKLVLAEIKEKHQVGNDDDSEPSTNDNAKKEEYILLLFARFEDALAFSLRWAPIMT